MHEASDLVLVQLRFKVHRGLVAEGAVEPLPVVKDFHPFKDRRPRLGAGGEVLAVNEAAFERAPEAFHECVVAAVAPAAHAGNAAGLRQPLAIRGTGILHALIRIDVTQLFQAT